MDQPPTTNTTSTTPPRMPQMATLRCSLQSLKPLVPSEDDGDNNSDDNDDSSDDYCYDDERNEKTIKDMWLSKAIALCRHLWPSIKDDSLSVDFLSHGSFNSIFSISMVTTKGETVEYVLRIPEFYTDLTETVAILEYLTKFTDLKVPTVISWDVTKNNPLGHVYAILSRVPGQCLANVWKDLAHDQKLLLAEELARLYHQIESVTNPIAGVIKVHQQDIKCRDELIDRTFVEAFGAESFGSAVNSVNWHAPKDGILPIRHDPPGLPVSDIMVAIFKRRIYEKKNLERPDEFALRWYELCQRIVEDMVEMGLFDSQNQDVCLCHPDLFPRNIMVDFSPNITITGVLDWDDALFVPRFASRVFPRWLWQTIPVSKPTSKSSWHGSEPLDPKKNEPDSPQNAEIKLAFENAVGEDWVSEATGEWFSLARALLSASQSGILSNSLFDDLARYKEKWKSLSTDAVGNLHFWMESRNLPIFEEPDSPESEEAPANTISRGSEPILRNREDDERVSGNAGLPISQNDRTRAEFRENLRWSLSMPKILSHSEEEQNSGEDSS